MPHENIPDWLIIATLLGCGIYFLGRYEGWWVAMKNDWKNRKNK